MYSDTFYMKFQTAVTTSSGVERWQPISDVDELFGDVPSRNEWTPEGGCGPNTPLVARQLHLELHNRLAEKIHDQQIWLFLVRKQCCDGSIFGTVLPLAVASWSRYYRTPRSYPRSAPHCRRWIGRSSLLAGHVILVPPRLHLQRRPLRAPFLWKIQH